MNDIRKQFATYEIALAIKELGFDEECLLKLQYMNDCDSITKIPYEPTLWFAKNIELKCDITKEQLQKDFNNALFVDIDFPLWQQIIDWFMEKYNLSIEPYSRISSGWGCSEIDSIEYSFKIVSLNEKYSDYDDNFKNKYSRYGAIYQAILKTIEIIKTNYGRSINII
jgi:hypothetical protein